MPKSTSTNVAAETETAAETSNKDPEMVKIAASHLWDFLKKPLTENQDEEVTALIENYTRNHGFDETEITAGDNRNETVAINKFASGLLVCCYGCLLERLEKSEQWELSVINRVKQPGIEYTVNGRPQRSMAKVQE